MAFSLIANTAAVSTTSAIDTTGATLIVIGASYDSAATVSDNKGNTYTAALTNTTYNTDMAIYYCVNPVVGSGHTFTISLSYCTVCVAAFSGVKVSPVDKTSSAGTNSATSVATGSISQMRDNELIISVLAGGGTSTGYSENSTLSVLNSINAVNGVSYGAAMAYEIQTVSAAKDVTWSWTNAAPVTVGIVSFLAEPEIKKINGVYMGSQEIASTRFAAGADAYYRFESGAITTDSSPNGKTLTSTGTITTGTGRFGDSASATWSNSNYLHDATGALNVGAGAFTIGCWFKKNGFPSADYTPTIICLSTSAGSRVDICTAYSAAKNHGYAYFQTFDGTNSTDVATTTEICDNVWHHLVATRTGTTHTLYVDGVATTVTGTARNIATDILYLGRENDSTYDHMGAAEIDEAFTYPSALTSDEIYSLYKTGVKKLNGQVNLNPELESTSLRGDANLVGYWRFEDNALDETTNNNDLTTSGSPAYATGKMGKGLDLELSSSQYAYIADANQTGLDITGDISINCWIKPEQIGITHVIASKWNSTDATSYLLYVGSDNKLVFLYSDTGSSGSNRNGTTTSAMITSAGVWYHVVVTVDVSASLVNFYVNGTSTAVTLTGSAITSIANTNANFAIGCNYTSGSAGNFFDGVVDDVGIFSRILTSTEISNLYNTNIKKYGGVSNT